MSQPIEQKYFPGDEVMVWCWYCESFHIPATVTKLVSQGNWEQEGNDNVYRIKFLDNQQLPPSCKRYLDINGATTEELLRPSTIQHMKNTRKNKFDKPVDI